MNNYKRVILLILDSVGVGELPDAEQYGDKGANTVGNVAEFCNGLTLPNLQEMGLGNIIDIKGVDPVEKPTAHYGKMAEASAGKDTTTGHWELAGLQLESPFRTYPNGFPNEIINKFQAKIGREVIGNIPASGTKIIEDYGDEHLRTGKPIVYTSADSVFQIAAHEQVIPLDELYTICQIAREMLHGEHAVARVIARPFIGSPGSFERTTNRKDYSVSPPDKTVLDNLIAADRKVLGIGKISDIFNCQGITSSIKTKSNLEGLQILEKQLAEFTADLVFANLVDFDMLYGHRNDPVGYANALKEVDAYLPKILNSLQDTDLLIITADHGCDPTMVSTDHSREYVPLLAYHNSIKQGSSLGVRATFVDVAATIAEALNVNPTKNGTSFLHYM
ncbi:phosphopentomutase [Desulfuribacillus alkaliarsenatis]|uniref:Phosphopentomutase n=1 Tax=Desulfuribacillus alkaliarsenatis TaxID=766136 RepID=A0A1E5G6V2_9FIRM|nr:phosphopentomutase [Desulfuribacillus alkaliarsenatis]OEF98474.1 phosphopentomutase [Desulfuribacillus alkaliarsenatis]